MYIEFGSGSRTNKSYNPFSGTLPNMVSSFMNQFFPLTWTAREMKQLTKMYEENSVLFTVLNIKADYFSSMRIGVKNTKTGEIYRSERPELNKNIDPIAAKMLKLMSQPNPFQSRAEILKANSISHDLYGNSYIHGVFDTIEGDKDITSIVTIKNLSPEKMKPIVKKNGFLSSTKENDVLLKWEYTDVGGEKKPISTETILHRKDVSMCIGEYEDYILGKSRAIPLAMPLKNVQIDYESLNVIGQERGMAAIITNAEKDSQLGGMPLSDPDKKQIQKDLSGYGTLEGQSRFMVLKNPVSVTQLDQDIRKLGLQEDITSNAIATCYAYGVPKLLYLLAVSGATYVNLESAERQMYENTTIRFANDWIEDMNNWLNPMKYGFEWIATFDHIKVLQENDKDRAIINRNNSVNLNMAFRGGTCTMNEWRVGIGLDKTSHEYGDKFLWQMPRDVQEAILSQLAKEDQNNDSRGDDLNELSSGNNSDNPQT